MKTTCKLILILSLITLLSNCQKEKYHNVPVEYLPVYLIGDTLIYSNGIIYDTLIINDIYTLTPSSDDKNHYQYTYYKLGKIKNKQMLNKYYAGFSYDDNLVSIYFDKFDALLIYANSNSSLLLLKNKVYTNVFKLDTQHNDTSRTAVKTVYFNYKFLVIRYINNSNDTFDLINWL